MYVTEAEDTGENVEPDIETVDVGGGILSVTLTLFTVTDTVYEYNGMMVPISGGMIIDRDIVVSAAAHRGSEETSDVPLADLKGTLVHELGHFLGLDHTPLNNLRAVYLNEGDDIPSYLIESPVVWMTMPDGVPQYIGATPTMFPIYFEVELPNGEREDGGQDLAPDDISGISWLYPRGAQENFLTYLMRHGVKRAVAQVFLLYLFQVVMSLRGQMWTMTQAHHASLFLHYGRIIRTSYQQTTSGKI
jgi:hypothetical protein